jgi:hypothetical protein
VWKTKKLRGIHRQKGDIISLLTKIRRDRQTEGQRDREKGDLISLILVFKNKESRLKLKVGL